MDDLVPRTLSLGYENTCIVSMDNLVLCFGGNNYGQLGIGSTDNAVAPENLTAIEVGAAGSEILAVSSGWATTCLIARGNHGEGPYSQSHLGSPSGAFCFGAKVLTGTEGAGNVMVPPSVPVPVRTQMPRIIDIASHGNIHTCFIRDDFGLKCTGLGDHGQLGTGNTDNVLSPSDLRDPLKLDEFHSPPQQLGIGIYHTCVLIQGSGKVKCFGYGAYG